MDTSGRLAIGPDTGDTELVAAVDEAGAVAQRLAEHDPAALRTVKRALWSALEAP